MRLQAIAQVGGGDDGLVAGQGAHQLLFAVAVEFRKDIVEQYLGG